MIISHPFTHSPNHPFIMHLANNINSVTAFMYWIKSIRNFDHVVGETNSE